jgi:hypothetical protein
LRAHLIALLPLVLLGCAPTCEQTCRHVLACGADLGSERVAQAECEDQCAREDALYAAWEDQEKMDAFDDHRRCVVGATCEELVDGACYDPLLFPYGTD